MVAKRQFEYIFEEHLTHNNSRIQSNLDINEYTFMHSQADIRGFWGFQVIEVQIIKVGLYVHW